MGRHAQDGVPLLLGRRDRLLRVRDVHQRTIGLHSLVLHCFLMLTRSSHLTWRAGQLVLRRHRVQHLSVLGSSFHRSLRANDAITSVNTPLPSLFSHHARK